jgi:hypothetical protein
MTARQLEILQHALGLDYARMASTKLILIKTDKA